MFGDALCSFNPVYGQGMTVAAQEAMLLRECLDAGAADLARRFFPRAADRDRYALGHRRRQRSAASEGRGAAPAEGALHQLVYRQAAHGGAARRKAGDAFLEVANLEAPPTRLLQPAVVMRVIRGNLGRRSGGTEAAPAGAQA